MIEIIIKGGWLMIVIILASMLGVAVFLERLATLRRARKQTAQHMAELRELLETSNVAELSRYCQVADSPITNILYSGLRNYQRSHFEIREAIESTGKLQAARLERNMNLLYTVATVAPLIGFLGTVLGMVKAFQKIEALGGGVNATVLAGGIWEALITTVGGLVVGIPLLIAYHYLAGGVDTFILELEENSLELMDLILSHKERI